jgi:hypothetical protein
LVFNFVYNIVIKPGPAWRVDPGAGPVRVLKRPVNAMTRSNPVDPAGQPVIRARPDQDLVFLFFVFFQMKDLKPISIYNLYSQEKNYVFSMWDKKLFDLSTSF